MTLTEHVYIAAGGSTVFNGGATHLYTFATYPEAMEFILHARLLITQPPQYIAAQAGAIEWAIYPCAMSGSADALAHLVENLKKD